MTSIHRELYLFRFPSDESGQSRLAKDIFAFKPSWRIESSDMEVEQGGQNNDVVEQNDNNNDKQGNAGSSNSPDEAKCLICGVVIKFKKNMRRHIKVAHQSKENKFECFTCSLSYDSKYHYCNSRD